MSKNLIIELLSQDGYYTLNKKLVKLIGLENAFLLSFFIDKYKFFKDKFFYTKENILNETRLTEYSLNSSLRFLKDNDLITIIKKGCPAKNYYNINFNKIQNLLEDDTVAQSKNNASSSIETTDTSDTENNITSECEFNTTSGFEFNTTSNTENTTTYNSNNKISNNKEIRTNNKENILKENFSKNKINEIQTQNKTHALQKINNINDPSNLNNINNLNEITDKNQQNKTKIKTQLLKNDPNFQYFLEIANRIKQLVETQKRINITNMQVANWAMEISKLYKTLEAIRGNKEAIDSMFLMINTLNADINYQDKYKPVIESGKSFREKFIKIEDYYKKRQIQIKKQQEYDNGEDILLWQQTI